MARFKVVILPHLYSSVEIEREIISKAGGLLVDGDQLPSETAALEEAEKNHEVLTGVFYMNTEKPNFLEMLHIAEEPLATLPQSKVRPPKEVLDEVMEELR